MQSTAEVTEYWFGFLVAIAIVMAQIATGQRLRFTNIVFLSLNNWRYPN